MNRKIDRHLVETVLLSETLQWEADPDQFLWLRAVYKGKWLRIKINPKFPDGPAYFLILSDAGSGNFELVDFPPVWTRGPLKWPDSARR